MHKLESQSTTTAILLTLRRQCNSACNAIGPAVRNPSCFNLIAKAVADILAEYVRYTIGAFEILRDYAIKERRHAQRNSNSESIQLHACLLTMNPSR